MKRIVIALFLAASGLTFAAPVPKDTTPAKLGPPTEKEFAEAKENLKQILIGFHNFCSAENSRLPNNLYTKDGKPLLSWRVAILPHIKQEALYKQFKLDEAWDSDNNKKLIAKMPKLYAPIRVKAKEGETFYRVFTGQGLFGPGAKYQIGNIPDGTSNTGLVFEAGEAAVWTKPEGLEYDATKPLPKLGGHFDGICFIGLGDGTVFKMRKDPDAAELDKVIVPDDGIPNNFDKIEAK